MALSPQSNESLLREVDDAVRQDQLKSFWDSYGRWLIAAVVVGLLAFGGYLYWQHHHRTSSAEVAEIASAQLDAVQAGKAPDAAKLAEMRDSGYPGYAALADLAAAADAVRQGKAKDAAAIYDRVAANDDLAQPYRDLATLKKVALNYDAMQPQQVIDALGPLAVKGGPWFGSAGEMTAIAYMRMGKEKVAGTMFGEIAKDGQVPDSIRTRARQMAGLLGVDTIDEAALTGSQAGEGDDDGQPE